MNKAKAAPDTSERELAQRIAFGLPIVTIGASIAIGFASSVGPAILVLAGGALIGTIAFFWASVRTLSGDAPLAEYLAEVPAHRHTSDAAERKRRILRALKDLEHEHAVGKIEDADYEQIAAEYRAQAKEVMRELEEDVAPLREQAEEIARKHLAKRGLADGESASASDEVDRRACAKCGTSNEADAQFCKKCGTAVKEGSDAST
jgi:hypothetical protein